MADDLDTKNGVVVDESASQQSSGKPHDHHDTDASPHWTTSKLESWSFYVYYIVRAL